MLKAPENKMFIRLENKSEVPIHGVAPGKTVRIEADAAGMPLDKQWRRRMKDADKCIGMQLVVENTAKKNGAK